MQLKSLVPRVAACLFVSGIGWSQEAPPEGRQLESGIPQVSVIDKFLAIEASLNPQKHRRSEEDWARDYEELFHRFQTDGKLPAASGDDKSNAFNSLALGVKIADAELAIKARDLEGVNIAIEQIALLGAKLGASGRELDVQRVLRRYAEGGHWYDAFMALGFLQSNILSYLGEIPEKKPQASLIVLGEWMQGSRCVASLIEKEYSEEAGAVLREPRFVDLLKKSVDELPLELLKEPLLQDIARRMPEIRERVAVGFNEPVKLEDVKWLRQVFDGFVARVLPESKSNETSGRVPPGRLRPGPWWIYR